MLVAGARSAEGLAPITILPEPIPQCEFRLSETVCLSGFGGAAVIICHESNVTSYFRSRCGESGLAGDGRDQMTTKSTRGVSCPNESCRVQDTHLHGNVVLHGHSKLKRGRRRRYRCTACGKTFGATLGTPYRRLQHTMRKFDCVAAAVGKFNYVRTGGYDLTELQLDELEVSGNRADAIRAPFTCLFAPQLCLMMASSADMNERRSIASPNLGVYPDCFSVFRGLISGC